MATHTPHLTEPGKIGWAPVWAPTARFQIPDVPVSKTGCSGY
jgi:hypothetical protein